MIQAKRSISIVGAFALCILTTACASKQKTGEAGSTSKNGAASTMPGDPIATSAGQTGTSPIPQELSFPDEDFRKGQPQPKTSTNFQAPNVERFRLANGIEVFLVENHDLPTVNLRLQFPGGRFMDPRGKEGLSSQCMELIDDGTKALTKLQFEEAAADLASSIGTGSSQDSHYVAASSLSKNFDETLDLWAETLLHPGLRSEDFDRNKKAALAQLMQAKGSASAIANRVSRIINYGPTHIKGRVVTEKSLEKIKGSDCKKFHATTFKPNGAKLFVAGDITRSELEISLASRLNGWKGKTKKTPRVAKANPLKGKIFFVDVPGVPQSVVRIMHQGPKRTASDYYATSLMNAILGGSFSSRINMNIREEHGYAYGARGGLNYDRYGSTYVASSSVRADVTVESIKEMFKEISELQESGEISNVELAREKEGALLSLPARFATKNAILGTYSSLDYFGLPIDYYDNYLANIQKVDQSAIAQAAKKYLQPQKAVIFIVGDKKTVFPSLKAYAKELKVSPKNLVELDFNGKKYSAWEKRRMCGRFTLKSDPKKIADFVGLDVTLSIRPRYNIAPSQQILVLVDAPSRQLKQMRWGLVPSFQKTLDGGHINARSESVADKPSFKSSVRKRRCLIIADGFYEWRKGKSGKEPMLIEEEDGELFALAGIWNTFSSKDETDDSIDNCAILTMEAQDDIASIHHRMPARVRQAHWDLWLDPSLQDAPMALQAILPQGQGPFRFRPVSQKVNSAAHEGPDCIADPEPPVQPGLPGL